MPINFPTAPALAQTYAYGSKTWAFDGTGWKLLGSAGLVSYSANTTLALLANNSVVLHPSSDTAARTFTLPANASVAFPAGTVLTFVNQRGAGALQLAVASDALVASGFSGSYTAAVLNANTSATAYKLSATEWLIAGASSVVDSSFSIASLYSSGQSGLWYDLTDGTTLTTDTAGTAPVTSGQQAARVKDKSGRGLHAVQATLANRGVYATAPPSLVFDGVNDGYAVATFVAGTLGANMDYFVAVKRATSANFVLATAVLGNQPFFAAGGADPATLAAVSAGTPTFFVNGVAVAGGTGTTIQQLGDAVPVGAWCVVELRNLNLAAWTEYKFGNSTAFELNGAQGSAVLCVAQSDAVRAQIRQSLSDSVGSLAGTYATVLGDSTIAAYLGANAVSTYLATSRTLLNLAVPGDTIAMQKTAWQGAALRAQSKWVMIEVGLNDVLSTEATAPVLARLQDLVNTVIADAPLAKVLIAQMTPCKGRLMADLGATNGPVAYQKWLDLNTAIAGGGASPITGVQGRVSAHVPLLNDGAGNLLAQYDQVSDFIHPNNAGRQIMASAWTNALNAAGIPP
ncbi:hypothetical protein [Polaromonas sp. CG9_12]|nr:hypothetical protein [Polaromonas sp. CG9_12]